MAPEVSYNDYLVQGWGRMKGVCDRCGSFDGGDPNHCDDCRAGLVWHDLYHLDERGLTMLCIKCLSDNMAVDQRLLMATRKYSHFSE
jgi:hypothetical protein